MYSLIDILNLLHYIVYRKRNIKEQAAVNLSYQEKSIAGTLIATLLVYGNYFAQSILRWQSGAPDPNAVGRLLSTMALLIGIEVVYHILISVMDRPSPKDERDRLIDANAQRNAYGALVTGVVLLMGFIMITEAFPNLDWYPAAPAPFLLAQAMLAAVVLAETVKSVTQLYYYKAGL